MRLGSPHGQRPVRFQAVADKFVTGRARTGSIAAPYQRGPCGGANGSITMKQIGQHAIVIGASMADFSPRGRCRITTPSSQCWSAIISRCRMSRARACARSSRPRAVGAGPRRDRRVVPRLDRRAGRQPPTKLLHPTIVMRAISGNRGMRSGAGLTRGEVRLSNSREAGAPPLPHLRGRDGVRALSASHPVEIAPTRIIYDVIRPRPQARERCSESAAD
jgi:hypothetical protein